SQAGDSVQNHVAERDVYSTKNRPEQTPADFRRPELQLTNYRNRLTQLRQQAEGASPRRAASQRPVDSGGSAREGVEKEKGGLAQQLEGWRAEMVRLETRQRELEQEWESGRTRVTQMEDRLRMGRQTLQEVREQRSHAVVERARNDSDRQHLRETCMTEVNAQPEDLIATETAFISGEELAVAET